MATMNPYGKLDEAEQERLIARTRTRRRITIIGLSSIVLVAVIVGAVVGATQTKASKSGLMISPLPPPSKLFAAPHYQRTLAAIQSCQELLSLALDHLNSSLSVEDLKFLEVFDDLRTWLSSAGTYQQTCIDELEYASTGLSTFLNDNFKNSTEYTSNSLAIVTTFEESISALGAIGRRRLMSVGGGPEWLSYKERKLLQTPSSSIKADAVVAKDGSGKYKTIGAALKEVPGKSNKRFVIYVKKGIYVENVMIEKSKWNVMIVGDGKNATIVSGSLNVVDGTPTFQSATFVLAKDSSLGT
ncbi:UNVERIFIED_CONTAM: putative pectinesterase/pectinesterase inhibitor 46 [Sesamum radiatum]|uniref:Pectinesterase n=1 Tax=Sesamum radiatum TaxID=300843 RepID=A0AAW2THV6_SESRA